MLKSYSTILLLLMAQIVLGQVGFVNHGAVLSVGANAIVYIDGEGYGNYTNKSKNTKDGQLILDGKIIIEGGWFNNAAGDSALINIDVDGTVAFVNGGTQFIGGTRETKFENIEIRNNTTVSLSKDTYIKNQLILNNGIVETNSDSLIIENRNSDAIVGQSEYNFVCGNLRRYISTGSYQFPLEDGGHYLPAIIDIIDKGQMNFISAKFTASNSEVIPSGLSLDGTSIAEFLDGGFWTFTPNNGTGVQYDITLTSRGHTNGGHDPKQHAIFKRENAGGAWQNHGDHDNSTQIGTSTDAITVTRSNLTGFSDFIIGVSDNEPLPAELLRFYGECDAKGIRLIWETASERNNDFFTLHYSYDGVTFNELDRIPGVGNSEIVKRYAQTYENFTSDRVYFKLSQSDFDGQQKSFDIISVHCPNQGDNGMQCFAIGEGKVRLNFSSVVPEEYQVCLVDALSRVVWRDDITSEAGGNSREYDIQNLSSGMYVVTLYNSTQRFSKKLILN